MDRRFCTIESTPIGPARLVWEDHGIGGVELVRVELDGITAMLAAVWSCEAAGSTWDAVKVRAQRAAVDEEIRRDREAEWARGNNAGEE